jgi:tetratricopeptide (TPR) repeat protein
MATDKRQARGNQYPDLSQVVNNTTVQGDLNQNIHIGENKPYRLVGFDAAPSDLLPEDAISSPSKFLLARYETVPFAGRKEELAALEQWCDHKSALSVMLVYGAGGQGKTRLLRQFSSERVSAGWTVWQSHHQMETEPLGAITLPAAPPGDLGLVVVVDYAERWPQQDLRMLISDARMRAHDGPVRLLLAARPAGLWWQSLRNWLRNEFWVPAVTFELRPLGRQVPRMELFASARRQFAEIFTRPDAEHVDPPDTFDDDEQFDQVLAVQMAALAAVDAHTRNASVPQDLDRVSAYLLQREWAHWEKINMLSRNQLFTSPLVMSRAVYTAILCGPLSGNQAWDEAVRVLQMSKVADSADAAAAVLADHLTCYPCDTDNMVLAPLYPDRLGEDFIALTTPGHKLGAEYVADAWAGGAITRIITEGATNDQLSTVRLRRSLTVLVAGATRWPHLRRNLEDLLRSTPGIAVVAGSAVLATLAQLPDIEMGVLRSVERLLPDHNVDLDIGHCALTKRLTEYDLATNHDPATRANLLVELGTRLGNAGDIDEGLLVTEQAVEIYQQLTQTDPIKHEPGLAVSLCNLGLRLSAVGRWKEALATCAQAVHLCRSLTQKDPIAYAPSLAMSLNNLGVRLSGFGLRKEALEATEQAVQLYRRLTQTDATTFEPGVAMSLSNFALRLTRVGRWEEAVTASVEAIDSYRRLARANPNAYEPGLAVALNNHGALLSGVGRPGEAPMSTEQAVHIFRRLAAANPTVYEAGLAMSLNNLSYQLSGLGRKDEAVVATVEAVEVYRRLALMDTAVIHKQDLAMCLNNLGARLADMGRREEAVESIKQAVTIRKQLAPPYISEAYVDLAVSLNNLGVLLSRAGRNEEAIETSRQEAEARNVASFLNASLAEPDFVRPLDDYKLICAAEDVELAADTSIEPKPNSIYRRNARGGSAFLISRGPDRATIELEALVGRALNPDAHGKQLVACCISKQATRTHSLVTAITKANDGLSVFHRVHCVLYYDMCIRS